MDIESDTPRARPSLVSLLQGLIQDIKTLIVQEVRLAKHEVLHEVGRAKTAALSLFTGLSLILTGGLLLILMLVYLIQAFTQLPLWACYGIVGGLFITGGVVLLLKGKSTIADLHVIPPKTVQSMKESATWTKDRIPSPKT